MKKRWILVLTLLVCLCVLSACSGNQQRFNYKTAGSGQQNAGMDYDPLAEEDDYSQELYFEEVATPVLVTSTPAPTIRSDYAGATPVLIDPIDKPTATPAPKLAEFTYQTYDAPKIGVSFQGPTGWLSDAQSGYFTIQNPDTKVAYPATLVIYVDKVASNYSNSQLETEARSMLKSIGESSFENSGFAEFEKSGTAKRNLLGKSGVYANYWGSLENGTRIYGRVHVVCVDRVLYKVHLSAPREYWNEYKEGVYDKLLDTIKITK